MAAVQSFALLGKFLGFIVLLYWAVQSWKKTYRCGTCESRTFATPSLFSRIFNVNTLSKTSACIIVVFFAFLLSSFGLNNQRSIAKYNQGVAHHQEGQLDAAISAYTRSLELRPNFANALYNRGQAFYEKGNFNAAVRDYSAALLHATDLLGECGIVEFDILIKRAVAYSELEQYQKAITDLDSASELRPSEPLLEELRADLLTSRMFRDALDLSESGEKFQAIAKYDELLKLIPDYAEAAFNRGLIHEDQEDYDKAVFDYTIAINANLDCNENDVADAYHRRSFCHFNREEFADSLADIHKALELRPDEKEFIEFRDWLEDVISNRPAPQISEEPERRLNQESEITGKDKLNESSELQLAGENPEMVQTGAANLVNLKLP